MGGTCVVAPLFFLERPGNNQPATIEYVDVKDPTSLADNDTYNFESLPNVSMTTSTPVSQPGTFMQMQMQVHSSKNNTTISPLIA
jgi:hypothetical protein